MIIFLYIYNSVSFQDWFSSEMMRLYPRKQISVSFSRKSRDVNGSLMTHFCCLCTFFGPSIILEHLSQYAHPRYIFSKIRKLFYFVNYVRLLRTGSRKPELWATLSRQTFNFSLSWAKPGRRGVRLDKWVRFHLLLKNDESRQLTSSPYFLHPLCSSQLLLCVLCESHEISDCHQDNYLDIY